MTASYMRIRAPITAAALAGAMLLAACGNGGADGRAPSERPVGAVADRPALTPGPATPGTAAEGEGEGEAVPGAVREPDASADPANGDGTAAASPSTQDGAARGAEPRTAAPAPTRDTGSEAPPAGESAATTEQVLRATARAYESLRSIRAEFDQEMRNPLLGRTTRSSGTLFQRQPDRFLMRFSDPEGDVIVSDGEAFWIYYPSVDARQVIRAEGGGPQGLDLRAQFIGDPVRRFEATSHGQEAVRGRSAHVMTLVPREPLGYRSLKVWIDREDHLVRRFELTEENGNVRRFELRDMVLNPSLPDDLFTFTPPPGAQVVRR